MCNCASQSVRQQECEQSSSAALRRSGDPSPHSELEPLLTALHVPHISRAVQQSVLPVAGWSGSVELDPIIADCLLALQRYLVHHMPDVYHAVQDVVAPLLLNLRSVRLHLLLKASSTVLRNVHLFQADVTVLRHICCCIERHMLQIWPLCYLTLPTHSSQLL